VGGYPSPLTPLPQAGEGNLILPLPLAGEGNLILPLPLAGEGVAERQERGILINP